MGHRAAKFAILFFFLDRLPLVVLLLAAGDAQFQLGPAILEINRHGDESRAANLSFLFQPMQLTLVDEQFSFAQRLVTDMRFFVWVDMAAVQDQLAALDARERFSQLAIAVAERFHLAAEQRDAALDFMRDKILVRRPAIDDARVEVFLGVASHTTDYLRSGCRNGEGGADFGFVGRKEENEEQEAIYQNDDGRTAKSDGRPPGDDSGQNSPAECERTSSLAEGGSS